MEDYIWKDCFGIGVSKVDLQHQGLLHLLNTCLRVSFVLRRQAALSEENIENVHELFDKLKDYANTHFQIEEDLMIAIEYPDIEPHKRKHAILRDQVAQLEAVVDSNEKGAITSMVTLLRDWYLKHILDDDKQIGNYMQQLLSGKVNNNGVGSL